MAKPIYLIVCDKGPKTSFGRVAESFRRALAEVANAQLVWLTNNQDAGIQNEQNRVCSSWTRETGRWSYPQKIAKLVHAIQPQWILLIRPELGFLVDSLRHAAPQAKLTLMIHDTFAETLYPHSFKFWLLNRFWIMGCDRVDSFLFNSSYTQREAQKVFALHGPQAICGCVIDAQDFFPLTNSREELREKWGLPHKPVLLNISLEEPRKNIKTFLDLAQRMPDLEFVRIGPVSVHLAQDIHQRQLPNLHHFAKLDLSQLREFYHLADVFIFPSLLEGFGVPPLEALACGTPVVSSNTSAMAEILPAVARLVSPLDLESWELEIRAQLKIGHQIPENTAQCLWEFSPTVFQQKILKHLGELGVYHV